MRRRAPQLHIPNFGLRSNPTSRFGFSTSHTVGRNLFWLTVTTVQLLGVTIFLNSRVAETAILVSICWLCSTKPNPEWHTKETSRDLASTLIWGQRCGIFQCDVMLGMEAHQTTGNFCLIFLTFFLPMVVRKKKDVSIIRCSSGSMPKMRTSHMKTSHMQSCPGCYVEMTHLSNPKEHLLKVSSLGLLTFCKHIILVVFLHHLLRQAICFKSVIFSSDSSSALPN